ncbi:type VI secretion system Vgr family protein, partial [Paludibacterium purpuratum]|uniref:type VI secretion system Vgr family protein n=1 Tax=Paludibacterium purpuratum TaxID=1144873 RepID=UPI00105B8979
GQEAVSDGYRYTVDCLSPDAQLALKDLLGLSARLAIRDQNGDQVLRGGVISQAEALGSDGGFSRYRLTVEPPFALLRHRTTSRVFQDLSVPDIVKQVIAEHQANNPVFTRLQTLAFQLSGQHAPRSYTLQYRESDYDFLRRLLHEEGLAWRFEHVSAGSTLQSQLTVFDDPYSLPQSSQQRVRFHRSDATESEDGLTDWQAHRRLGSSQVSLASYDYKAVQTGQGMDSSMRDLSDSERAAQSTLEDYQPQTLYYAADADGLTRYAQQRQQAHDLAAQGFEGGGTIRGLHAGHWFRLDNHPQHDSQPADRREFVVTQQQFSAHNNLPAELGGSEGAAAPFSTRFSAQPRGLPLSPAYGNTALAKPTARGAQTATVVGPAGEEVHTDEQGRIKVQLHWQRGAEHPEAGANFDERSSCWVRVAMPSAGAAWGHQFIPRIGQEVLI